MSLSGNFQLEMKRQSTCGRCLHFANGDRCSETISAHSIQKSGQLSSIAEDGHVYQLTADLSILKRTNGRPEPKKVGVNRVSTFAGFCKTHDNDLFKLINRSPLSPTHEQITLYAYRSICREYFVKENAVRLLKNFEVHPELDVSVRGMLSASLKGQSIGLSGLMHHKAQYDLALETGSFSDFEYIVFFANSNPSLALSGVLYPDFDFSGNPLQRLGSESKVLDLVTFFTAPASRGWVYCFAWHLSSHTSCESLIRSLRAYVAGGGKIEDALLRFSVSCCENHAFRISWWDKLPPVKRTALLDRFLLMTAPHISFPPTYLNEGCEHIAEWKIEHVLTTLQTGA